MSDQQADGALGFRDLLAGMAVATLLRDNPFRVLGLPTDATGGRLQNEGERLVIMQRLAGGGGGGGGPDAAGAALHRLRDPRRRLVDELLWFWPDGERLPPSVGDLSDSARRDAAAADLAARAAQGDGVAQHNLAVLRTLRFVEGPEGEAPRRGRDALVATTAMLAAPATHAYLAQRVAALDDPRLQSGDAARLVDEAKLLLPLFGARQAVRMLQESAAIPAVELAAVIREHTAPAVAETAFRDALDPLVRRVRSAVTEAERAAGAAPRRGAACARQLLDQSADERATIGALVGRDDPQRAGVFDAVAGGVVSCAGGYYNETFEARPTRDLLLEAQALEPGPATRARIAEGLGVVDANASSSPSAVDFAGSALSLCWFCLAAPSSGFAPMQVALARFARAYGTTRVERDMVAVPRCPTCLSRHAGADRRERRVRRLRLASLIATLWLGLAYGVAILSLLGILLVVMFLFGRIHRAVILRGPLSRAVAYPAVQARLRDGWLVAPRYSGTGPVAT